MAPPLAPPLPALLLQGVLALRSSFHVHRGKTVHLYATRGIPDLASYAIGIGHRQQWLGYRWA